MFKFGIAKCDITPNVGANLPGYFTYRPSGEILDNLYAKAYVFDDGENVFAFVVCDAVELYRKHVLKIREIASKATKIPEENISVSVTHSHTGGPTWTWESAYYEDEAYTDFLIKQSAEAIEKAYQNRKNARLGYVKSELPNVAFIRRFYLKDGTVKMTPGNPDLIERAECEPDNTFILMKVEYEDGTLAAFIENFALHADSVGKDVVSADYPGEVARLVKEKYGDEVENIFINSAGGDVNHVNPFAKKINTYKDVAKIIFEKIESLADSVKTDTEISVEPKTFYFKTKKRKPTKENYDIAKKVLAGEDVFFKGYPDEDSAPRKVFAVAAKKCYESTVEELEVEIKTLKLGDIFFAIWPGEMFCEFAKIVRSKFPGKCIAISAQANNTLDCYIPSEEAFKNGGYETRENVELVPCENAGYEIAENTIKLLADY